MPQEPKSTTTPPVAEKFRYVGEFDTSSMAGVPAFLPPAEKLEAKPTTTPKLVPNT